MKENSWKEAVAANVDGTNYNSSWAIYGLLNCQAMPLIVLNLTFCGFYMKRFGNVLT